MADENAHVAAVGELSRVTPRMTHIESRLKQPDVLPPGAVLWAIVHMGVEDEKRAEGDTYRSRNAATPLRTTVSPESNSLP
jgi:hypothetical protein